MIFTLSIGSTPFYPLFSLNGGNRTREQRNEYKDTFSDSHSASTTFPCHSTHCKILVNDIALVIVHLFRSCRFRQLHPSRLELRDTYWRHVSGFRGVTRDRLNELAHYERCLPHRPEIR